MYTRGIFESKKHKAEQDLLSADTKTVEGQTRKNRKYRLTCIFLCVLLTLTGIGCDGMQTLVEPYMKITAYQSNGGRQVRNGTERREFQVEEGSAITMTVTVEQKAGFLAIWIAKDGKRKNAVFDESDMVSSTTEVSITESGNYIIWIEAADFEGSYSFETDQG